MVIVKVPSTTDLCENGAQAARRKRDMRQILDRDRRANAGIIFLLFSMNLRPLRGSYRILVW